MALKCSHCPQSFCGFCYGHAGTWQESHAHVCTCVRNPRENFYAESEQVWRELMRLRRIRLAEGIIAQRPALNPTECILIRSEYSKLL